MERQRKSTAVNKWVYGAEVLAGLVSGLLVTPFTVVVDKSVVLYANGTSPLWKSVRNELSRVVRTPLIFMGSFEFKWMYLVYACTYSASNLADHVNFSEDVSHPIQKLLMVFLVNTTCSLLKDKAYAQHFGKIDVRPFPISSLSLLFGRDIVAMASAFTLPPILGQHLTTKYGFSAKNGERIGQITCPLLVQLIGTPLHLYALDLYNRSGLTFSQRIPQLRKVFPNTLLLRMMRFLPTYGLGGIANIELRKSLKSRVSLE